MVGCETTVGLNIDEVVTSYTESLSFTAEGGEDAIEFDLLCDWKASISEGADWLTLNKYSGNSGRNYIDVTAEENKSIEAREAVITIYNDIYKVSKEVTVYQEANDPYITLSNNDLEFDKNESSRSIEIESNTSWKAKCDAEWISLSPTSGSKGKTTMSVSSKENPYGESRTTTITIVDNNQTELAKINVKQGGSSAYINLSNNSIAVKFNIPYTLNIESSITWAAEYDADIISVTPNSGIGKVDATITIIGHTTESVDIRFYNDDFGVSTTLHITPDYTNCIFYTTSDGNIVSPYNSNAFGATIISNKIINGVGAIVFDDSTTTIGKQAFYACDSLTSVTIPDSVTTIGYAAFLDCSSLSKFNGKYASDDGRCLIVDGTLNSFAPSGLTEYTIPDSVTTIGYAAYLDCSSLTSITIPDSVTTIGSSAFSGCSSLTSVTIPDSVTTIGSSAFSGCSSLTSVTIGDSVTTIGNNAFNGCKSHTSVTIPDSVTTIGMGAFYGCSSLTSVTIPDSVTTIGDYAFEGCSSLTSATIGDSVTTIGESAFESCSSLASVTIGDSVTTIGNSAFSGCSSLTSVTISDSVTTIGDGAFRNCSSLTSVTIPDSVTTIGYGAFFGCSSLTSVTIPNSVTTIGYCAFSGCSRLQEFNGQFASEDRRCLIVDGVLNSFAPAGLTEYTIPNSVTTIGEWAFGSCCSSFTSVTIPDSVTSIGYAAFANCSGLSSVYCKATTPPVALISFYYWIAFDDNASGRKIYVPMESVNKYKSASGWCDYASDIVGYNF